MEKYGISSKNNGMRIAGVTGISISGPFIIHKTKCKRLFRI